MLIGDYFGNGLGSHGGKEKTSSNNSLTAVTAMTVLPSPRSAGQSTAGVMKSRPITRIYPELESGEGKRVSGLRNRRIGGPIIAELSAGRIWLRPRGSPPGQEESSGGWGGGCGFVCLLVSRRAVGARRGRRQWCGGGGDREGRFLRGAVGWAGSVGGGRNENKCEKPNTSRKMK